MWLKLIKLRIIPITRVMNEKSTKELAEELTVILSEEEKKKLCDKLIDVFVDYQKKVDTSS